MDIPPYETVAALIQCHRDSLGLEQVDQVETALLGQGEANLNVLVTVNQAQRFNLRIGLREAESERTLQREYDLLQLVPAGIGPRAYALDFSRRKLPQPYMLLDYLAGELKTAWDITDLEAHACTLARLHQQKFAQHGAIGQLSDPPYDFLHRFDTGVAYWQTHHPYLLDIPVVQRLLPPIRQHISDNNELFLDLRRFTLVHGDAHPLNILFDGDHISYIDWEWAAIGDPADLDEDRPEVVIAQHGFHVCLCIPLRVAHDPHAITAAVRMRFHKPRQVTNNPLIGHRDQIDQVLLVGRRDLIDRDERHDLIGDRDARHRSSFLWLVAMLHLWPLKAAGYRCAAIALSTAGRLGRPVTSRICSSPSDSSRRSAWASASSRSRLFLSLSSALV